MPCSITGFFDIQEYRSHRQIIIKSQFHVVRYPHTFKGRAVAYMKAKLNLPLESFFHQCSFGLFF